MLFRSYKVKSFYDVIIKAGEVSLHADQLKNKMSHLYRTCFSLITCSLLGISLNGCKDGGKSKSSISNPLTEAYYDGMGVGPITAPVVLSETLNDALIAEGEGIFNSKCIACHQTDADRKIGPGMKGVTKRKIGRAHV